jgi:hypothetical protein
MKKMNKQTHTQPEDGVDGSQFHLESFYSLAVDVRKLFIYDQQC